MNNRLIKAFRFSECTIQPSAKAKIIATGLSIALAVALPQVAHLLGSGLGVGNSIGATFLPMHLPILLVGFFGGPIVGGVAGLLSPWLSFLLSGMPVISALPLMMVELAAYGMLCGAIRGVKLPMIVKLLSAQVFGRLVRLLVSIAIALSSGAEIGWNSFLGSIWTGLPGLALQWLLIPVIMLSIARLYEEKKN